MTNSEKINKLRKELPDLLQSYGKAEANLAVQQSHSWSGLASFDAEMRLIQILEKLHEEIVLGN